MTNAFYITLNKGIKLTALIIISLGLIIYAIGSVLVTVYQDKFIFDPEVLPEEYHFEFRYPFEEINLPAYDGSKINALHFKIQSTKGVVLYFHGNSGSLREWGEVNNLFCKKGYDLFLYDYRGYGKSNGDMSEKYFHNDAEMVYKYLLKTYPEDKIFVYGRSLGTGFATAIAAKFNPKVLFLETPYYSFLTLAQDYFKYIPVRYMLHWTIRTDRWIQKVKCPVAIIHGTEDEIIPYSNAKKLIKKLKDSDEFVTLDGCKHNNVAEYKEYHELLNKFLP